MPEHDASRSGFSGQDLLTKIKWLITIRVMVITLILGSITVLQFSREFPVSFFPFPALIIITYIMTILYAAIIRLKPLDSVFFAYIQICGDLIIETALVFYSGGIRSPFSFTYILTIITTSILLSRKSSLIIASLSGLAYGLLLTFQYVGVVTPPYSYVPKWVESNLPYVSHTIFANIFAFYLTALLSGHLAESQRKAGKELQARDGDIAQLQTFNENILQSMSSGLLVTDLTGKVILMNRAAIQILGLSPQEIASGCSGHWNRFFQPLRIEKFHQSMTEAGRNSQRMESRIRKDGQEIFLGLTISILKNPHGKSEGLITNFQDLSGFKKMEEQVKQAEVMATIGQMSASIAHELRNPMASIRGAVQFLYDELGGEEKRGSEDERGGEDEPGSKPQVELPRKLHLAPEHRRLMEIVLKESNRLNKIITDFLLYAKPQPPNPERCSPGDLIQETITLIRKSGEWSEGIRIITEIPDSLPPIDIDPGQISQVFWNLAINACQAMPDGGILNIRARHTPDCFLLIEFADTGPGIHLEVIKKLFNPFYTTKDRGMGLGLSIAYRIVEEHKGKIEVTSAPGQGSTFRVYLPATCPANCA
jgi:two-component system sensor histidine kinase PilS (NtrC family)